MSETSGSQTRAHRAKHTKDLPAPQARLAVAALVRAGALERARQIVEVTEPAHRAELRAALADAFTTQGKFDAALAEYRAVLTSDARHVQAREGARAVLAHQAAQHAREKAWDLARALLHEAVALSPDDAPLTRYLGAVEGAALMSGDAFTGSLDSVIGTLEKLQVANPGRADIAHQLAILHHRRALELEETASNPPARDATWEKAIANWAATVESENYWREWCAARQVVFEQEIPGEELEKLRRDTLKARIKEMHQQYVQAYSHEVKLSDAVRHRRLMAAWSLELKTAAAMREVLAFLAKRGKKNERLIAAGPLYFKHTAAESAPRQAVEAALALDRSFQPAHQVDEFLKPTGLARALLDEAQVDEALVIIEQQLASAPRNASARELAAEAWLKKGESLASSAIEAAFKAWQQAKSFGATEAQIEKVMVEPLLQQIKNAEEAKDAARVDRILLQGLGLAPQNRLLKNKFAGIHVSGAIARANNAISKFERDENFSAAISELDQAMRALEEAHRLLPSDAAINKHISDLRQVRQRLQGVRAGKNNARAVQLANEAQSVAQRGNKWEAVRKLDEAERLLLEALQWESDATVRQNLSQVQTLQRILR